MARSRKTDAPDPSVSFPGRIPDTGDERDTNERRFAYYWGRRRLAHLVTLMPQDQREMERLDFQHHMLRKALGRNYLAPIAAPASVLDVGCGTGRWAIEMAEEFPAATVVGMDLLPPEPYGRTPSNCFFQYGNVFDSFPVPDGSFTFVHQRCFLDAIPSAAWPAVAHELVRVTRPGGYIELVEFGPPVSVGPALGALYQWMFTLGGRHGFDLGSAKQVGEYLNSAEATSVASRVIEIPLGRHGGRTGMLAQTNIRAVLQTLRTPFVQEGLTNAQTFDALLVQADRELETGQALLPLHVCCARRLM